MVFFFFLWQKLTLCKKKLNKPVYLEGLDDDDDDDDE